LEGLNALTIGRLAGELGVGKSGLFAHFGSKERLQLELANCHFVSLVMPTSSLEPGRRWMGS
jgi:hypothetical protein